MFGAKLRLRGKQTVERRAAALQRAIRCVRRGLACVYKREAARLFCLPQNGAAHFIERQHAYIRRFAQERLKDQSASAVLMNVRNGEIVTFVQDFKEPSWLLMMLALWKILPVKNC